MSTNYGGDVITTEEQLKDEIDRVARQKGVALPDGVAAQGASQWIDEVQGKTRGEVHHLINRKLTAAMK